MDFEHKSMHGRQDDGSCARMDPTRRRYAVAEEEWRIVLSGAQRLVDESLDDHLECHLISVLVPLTERQPRRQDPQDPPHFATGGGARPRYRRLRWLGDACLLYAGFYVEEARRHAIALTHLVDLGQRAYRLFAATQTEAVGAFYDDVARGFVPMMDVLHGVYELAYERSALDPLSAYDLYEKTGSRSARRALAAVTDGSPVWSDTPSFLS